MNELLKRLAAHPLLTLELGIASLFANLLALATPLFVIQVLNRYIASGVDATLITLTSGVILAIVLEFGFRQARLIVAMSVGRDRERDLAMGALGLLTTAKPDALIPWPTSHRREVIRGLRTIRSAYSAPNIAALLDTPFSLLFLAVLTALSVPLGVMAALFVAALFLFSLVSRRLSQKSTKQSNEINLLRDTLMDTACERIDTIRAFGGASWLMTRWQQLYTVSDDLNRQIEKGQGISQGILNGVQSLMSVCIITLGALLVVAGELEVGALIGANILAARALGPMLRMVQLSERMIQAELSLLRLKQFATVDVERQGGTVLKKYRGGLVFRELSKTLSTVPIPVFDSLNLNLEPGSVLAVSGDDEARKSVFARLIMTLSEPDQGQILADGVDLRQLDPQWWRQQLVYLPRDPDFLDGTIRENITLFCPDISPEVLHTLIGLVGLGPWLDESTQGLDTVMIDGGRGLSPSLRKRIALARALTSKGKLVLFDEPTENMDAKGVASVYSVLHRLSQEGATIIVLTNDPTLVRGSSQVLEFNSSKPTRIQKEKP